MRRPLPQPRKDQDTSLPRALGFSKLRKGGDTGSPAPVEPSTPPPPEALENKFTQARLPLPGRWAATSRRHHAGQTDRVVALDACSELIERYPVSRAYRARLGVQPASAISSARSRIDPRHRTQPVSCRAYAQRGNAPRDEGTTRQSRTSLARSNWSKRGFLPPQSRFGARSSRFSGALADYDRAMRSIEIRARLLQSRASPLA